MSINKYFVFSPEGCGFEIFDSQDEAREYMNLEAKEWEKSANLDGEWSENCESAIMGVITHEHKLVVDGNGSYDLCLVSIDNSEL